MKSIFKQLSQSWKSLTSSQILAWNNLAQTQMGKSVLGSSSKISGANLFMRLNYWRVYCGLASLSDPPTLVGVDAPDSATIVLNATTMTFTLASIPASVSDLKLVIEASAPQGNGITNAYSKATQFGDPLTPVATAIDIKANYVAKNGAASATSPKVFVRWFYVNTTTGEKSNDMMGLATFTTE